MKKVYKKKSLRIQWFQLTEHKSNVSGGASKRTNFETRVLNLEYKGEIDCKKYSDIYIEANNILQVWCGSVNYDVDLAFL